VKTVIVLGGYGGFGARLSLRLAADGWMVMVAGRNGEAAKRFAEDLPNATPIVADRNRDLTPILEEHRPFLLIDAAGPFQGSGYQVAQACIACGVHYIDLADARDFVSGISGLDETARARGVVAMAGASSVPAMSGAVIDELAQDMEDVCSVEMSISASNRATAGSSVAAAILSYVGKPVRLWHGRRWQQETGWHRLKRVHYRIRGKVPISRLVALSDVPDHDLVPARVPGRPATIFRAGPEFSFQLLTLWLLSWPVKWGWFASLRPLARWLLPLQKLSTQFGTDRSAMAIELKGSLGGAFESRRWTLIAEDGCGPEIPTIAAQLIANATAQGTVAAGARPAAGELSLAAFTPQFDRLAIFREIESSPYLPLYLRVMGEAFHMMPGPVREMHNVFGDVGAAGTATVERGRSFPARLVAAIMGFPPEGEHPLHVAFSENDGVERWTRDFGGHVFSSELSQRGRYVCERFGPMRFYFDLPSDASGLTMVMRRWSVFSVPMPMVLAPKSEAREWAEGVDFCFDVPIMLPLIGKVVHYRGRLRRL
jgi:NAD(P)-dependent dehydrogenase (short-subunit alcohol dehydrogenase family)